VGEGSPLLALEWGCTWQRRQAESSSVELPPAYAHQRKQPRAERIDNAAALQDTQATLTGLSAVAG